ncbi:diguanylate cyclase [Actinomarinicola tropica]|nr:diguanylate cyclase [Actinomarinicola tropica]
MDAPTWSREDLRAHVEGAQVVVRDRSGADVDAPEWLVGASLGVSEANSTESLEITHPDDRADLVASFMEATWNPGVVVERRIRISFAGMWLHAQVTWLDLTRQPEVGGVLCTVRLVDGPPIEPPEPGRGAAVHAATNWVILTLSPRGRISAVRGSIEGVLGYGVDDVVGRYATHFVHPESISGAVENWIELREHPEQTRTSRQVWVRADERPVWVESTFLVLPDGEVEMVIVDVDERVANEEALDRSRQELAALAEDFRLVADEVPLPVFRCDADGRIDFRNAQWDESMPDLGDAATLHAVAHPDSHADLDAFLAMPPGRTSRSVELLGADGQRMLSLRGRAVGRDDDRRIVGSITDITAALELHRRATHDPLTALPNRTQILADLEGALAEDPDGTLVLFIDLDGFKGVNDTYGHDVGDEVLAEVGRRLAEAVRPGDQVGRYGGDEFVVVCRGASETAGDLVAERLAVGALGRVIELDGTTWAPSASIGWARREEGDDPMALLRRADAAMFDVKRSRHGREGGDTLGR